MFGFTSLEVRTYGVLSVCGALQLLINQIEQPYARSLIACETPINATIGAEPSGSSMCGDRIYVIGEGAKLSGNGDSLENMGRFLITLFVSGFADSHGRKAAAIVGWVLITCSVLCFLLASFIQPWAKVLFVIAQGLQGMSGIGLISDIVSRDIAATVEGDPTHLFARRNMLGVVLSMVFFGIVLSIQYSQITEFRPVWTLIFLFSVSILAAVTSVLPETQPEADRKDRKSLNFSGVITNEVAVYRKVLRSNRYAKFSVVEAFFKNLSGGVGIIMLPWMMATFGYNQLDLMLMMAPCIVIGVLSTPLIPALCGKHGHRKVLMGIFWFDFITEWMFLPFLNVSVGFLPMPVLYGYLKTPCGGISSVVEALTSRLVPSEQSAKLAAMMQLNGFMTGSVASLVYTRVFHAEATTLLGKVAPFLLASSVKIIACSIFYFGHRDIVEAECEKLTEDVAKEKEEKEKADATKEAEKTDDAKKED